MTKLALSSVNGSIDLTQYLNVDKGDGMEPGDPSFTEKVFARSLLKKGATLTLEHLREKEQVFPLRLHASSKAALANLVQEINTILNTAGTQIEWQDAGATAPTYLDLISGQLDDEFDFRLGEHNWLTVKLRLFSQPLGYWSKHGARQTFGIGAIAGSAAAVRASAPVAVFQASGLLDGDAPALVQGHLLKESNEGSYPYVAMSILPSASYSPLLPVASMTNGALLTKTASTAGDSTGVNGLYWRSKNLNVGSDSLNWRPLAGALPAYVGKQRIGVLARTPAGAGAAQFALFDPVGETYGPTQTAVATSTWTLYDLGTISRASSMLLYGAPYEVNVAMFSSGVASTILDITAIVQFPDEQTVWLSGAQASSGETSRSTNHFTFDGVNSRVALGLNPGVPASGIAPIPVEPERYPVQLVDLTGFVRGQIPEAPVTNEPPVFAFLYAKRFGTQNGSMVVNVNVLERTRYIF